MATDVVFLTAASEHAEPLLRAVIAKAVDPSTVVVYHRASAATELGALLAEVDARSDKPAGSRLAFISDLRRSSYQRAHVLWTGDRTHDRMRLVALLCGAREVLRYDEELRVQVIDPSSVHDLLGLRWRPSLAGASGQSLVGSGLRRAYKQTVGWVVGALVIVASNLGTRRSHG